MSRVIETIEAQPSVDAHALKIALDQLPQPRQILMTTSDPIINKPVEPTPDGAVRIIFNNGEETYIKREWFDKYEVFRAPIIFREKANYDAWIYPLLNKQSLRFTKQIDESKELGSFLEEVNYYGLHDLLIDSVVQDISDNSGLTTAIIRIKKYVTKWTEKKGDCFGRRQKIMEEIELFKTEWQYYLDLLAVKYKNDKYKQLTADLIIDTMKTTDFLNLCVINCKYQNLVFQFCQWFEEFIIRHNHEKFTNFKMNLSLRLTDSVQTLGDIGTAITGVIQNFAGNLDKGALLNKISQLSTIKELLKN